MISEVLKENTGKKGLMLPLYTYASFFPPCMMRTNFHFWTQLPHSPPPNSSYFQTTFY